jgi:hypothetical protein
MALALGVSGAMGCAPRQGATGVSVAGSPSLPAKCTACHLAPKPRSLPGAHWSTFLKAHQRRLRISDADKTLLHGYLVGDTSVAPP